MLTLEQLVCGYGPPRGSVVDAVSLTVDAGAFVCLLGRNGAGKSTLMRTLAGLQPPLAGIARLDGDEVHSLSAPERARRIAVVLTERPSSPGLTVDDVVRLGRQPFTGWDGRLTDNDEALADEAVNAAGATPFLGRLIDDLSDGERQRVMIARAMAQTPRLMVLDEITAFLDLPGRVEVMAMLRQRARETGSAILLSSHDLDLSLQLADIVWLLDGSGALQVGTPEALIERGLIGEAFDTPDVAFSAERGRFELNSRH
ncbi:ABC transporter ATP-binding protein [Aquidulcibacter paucihalophilus]|jgi:iron complex transport system ATP-binding protein|nr:ABC transporter ATP-binding protein [Aquidulcibacter paucihalophilus]